MEYSVRFGSVTQSCPTLRSHESQHARPPCPSPTPGAYSNSCPSSQWCHPAISSSVIPFSSCPQPLPASGSLRIRWPKYWSFSFSISPSNEYPGPISFRMDWLDLLAVQGTLKSLLQLHSSKASILLRSTFFTVQLSHPHMTTGKTIALTRRTFVGKVMSLLFNVLSRLVITFLPRSKRLYSAIKKEHIWFSSNEVDHPEAYYAEWSKSERERKMSHTNTYLQNLERWHQRIYLQGSDGETDTEDRYMDVGRGEERVRCMEKVRRKLRWPYVKYRGNRNFLYVSGNTNRVSVST